MNVSVFFRKIFSLSLCLLWVSIAFSQTWVFRAPVEGDQRMTVQEVDNTPSGNCWTDGGGGYISNQLGVSIDGGAPISIPLSDVDFFGFGYFYFFLPNGLSAQVGSNYQLVSLCDGTTPSNAAQTIPVFFNFSVPAVNACTGTATVNTSMQDRLKVFTGGVGAPVTIANLQMNGTPLNASDFFYDFGTGFSSSGGDFNFNHSDRTLIWHNSGFSPSSTVRISSPGTNYFTVRFGYVEVEFTGTDVNVFSFFTMGTTPLGTYNSSDVFEIQSSTSGYTVTKNGSSVFSASKTVNYSVSAGGGSFSPSTSNIGTPVTWNVPTTPGTYKLTASLGSNIEFSQNVTIAGGCINISGHVLNDLNGMVDGAINGLGIYEPAGIPLYAYLVKGGQIVGVTTVDASASYSFPADPNANYSVVISKDVYALGAATPSASLPTGWENTGEGTTSAGDGAPDGVISFTTGMSSQTGLDFGINQIPVAGTYTHPIQKNPSGTTPITIPPSSFAGTDEDGITITQLRITAFPSNTNTLFINGIGYDATSFASTFPSGAVIPTDAAGRPTQTIEVDPIDGFITVRIPYTVYDMANSQDPTPGFADFPLDPSFPVILYSFDARMSGNIVSLEWNTSSEFNNDYFTIEKSRDAQSWESVLTRKSQGNSNDIQSYQASDMHPYSGASFYRLSQTDFDGTTTYFNIVEISNNQLLGEAYPSPCVKEVFIPIVLGSSFNVQVTDLQGKIYLLPYDYSNGLLKVELGDLASGMYQISIKQANSNQHYRIVKQ